jgi:Fe-S cluster biogenesis protein NfuA/nitrite reductase/ring-hydroxylating ferredoxin subunit
MDRGFTELAQDLDRLSEIAARWEPEQRACVQAIRDTVEALQRGAFKSLIKTIKEQPGGLPALQLALEDPWVGGVLGYHGLLRPQQPSIEDEVNAALDEVRPGLAGHGGDVELVAVVSPEEVQVRLKGSCDGCPSSEATMRLGVETAIKRRVPSVERVTVVARPKSAPQGLVQLGAAQSPFEKGWVDAGPLPALGEGEMQALELQQQSVLLAKVGGELRAFPNACPHLGMPLDAGELKGGILRCRYHAFSFDLTSGDCLTAPEVSLPRLALRRVGERLFVQAGR